MYIEGKNIWRIPVNGRNSIHEPYLTLLQYGEGVPITERHRF
jgi:hypothetical protein